jgi:ribose 5-phosphate isomerase
MRALDEGKRAAGFAAVDRFVRDQTCVGLGTGTTAFWAIERVGERVAAGERIRAVATSQATEELCRERGITLVAFGACEMDVAIDGADEVAADWSLTKGGGGALFREKAVALAARRFVVIVTPEKLVARLGAFPTPVEVVPYSLPYVAHAIEVDSAGASCGAARAQPRTSPTTATRCSTARSPRSRTRPRSTASCAESTASSRPGCSAGWSTRCWSARPTAACAN